MRLLSRRAGGDYRALAFNTPALPPCGSKFWIAGALVNVSLNPPPTNTDPPG